GACRLTPVLRQNRVRTRMVDVRAVAGHSTGVRNAALTVAALRTALSARRDLFLDTRGWVHQLLGPPELNPTCHQKKRSIVAVDRVLGPYASRGIPRKRDSQRR